MPDSEESDRERIVQKIISKYRPPCNTELNYDLFLTSNNCSVKRSIAFFR